MKQTQRFIYGLVACGIALAMASTLSAQTKDEVAKVVRISGSARSTTGGGVFSLQPPELNHVYLPRLVR